MTKSGSGVALGQQGQLIRGLVFLVVGEASGIVAGEAGVAMLRLRFLAHILAECPVEAVDREEGAWASRLGGLREPGKHDRTLPPTKKRRPEFFHRASRTLVLTDLIENFEPEKLPLLSRWLTKLGGAQHPDGQMPRDMRYTYEDKAALKGAVETMIGWDPARIILAHGRWYDRDGAAELRRAFRWLLA